ncbi:hypothetical protein DP49_3237 [Burkholderia pseudomallei]|nr:hypothetical protein DP49_3237 [Burkholderia pseudomallei]
MLRMSTSLPTKVVEKAMRARCPMYRRRMPETGCQRPDAEYGIPDAPMSMSRGMREIKRDTGISSSGRQRDSHVLPLV